MPTLLRRLAWIVTAAALLLCGLGAGLAVPRLPALRCLLAFQESVPEDLEKGKGKPPPGFTLLEDETRYGAQTPTQSVVRLRRLMR